MINGLASTSYLVHDLNWFRDQILEIFQIYVSLFCRLTVMCFRRVSVPLHRWIEDSWELVSQNLSTFGTSKLNSIYYYIVCVTHVSIKLSLIWMLHLINSVEIESVFEVHYPLVICWFELFSVGISFDCQFTDQIVLIGL